MNDNTLLLPMLRVRNVTGILEKYNEISQNFGMMFKTCMLVDVMTEEEAERLREANHGS